VKGPLKSEISYQGPTLSVGEENIRRALIEHPVNAKEKAVEEVPYEKKQACMEPIGSILSDPTLESE
jgi:hypothetical protein